MKNIKWISILVAVLAVLLIATPILADDGDNNVNVDVCVSDITVTGGQVQGSTATASGTVTITSTAEDTCSELLGFMPKEAGASSEAGYTITAPDGSIISAENNPLDMVDRNNPYWTGHGWSLRFHPAEDATADASQIYTWEYSFFLEQHGDYSIAQYGNALAYYLTEQLLWSGGRHGHFYWDYNQISQDACNSNNTTWRVAPYVPPTWYNDGRFEIMIGYDFVYRRAFAMTDGVLQEDVVIFADFGGIVKVVIPAGTKITGTDKLQVTYDTASGVFGVLLPQNAEFSNPVKVYAGDNLVLSFTKIVDGAYIPLP